MSQSIDSRETVGGFQETCIRGSGLQSSASNASAPDVISSSRLDDESGLFLLFFGFFLGQEYREALLHQPRQKRNVQRAGVSFGNMQSDGERQPRQIFALRLVEIESHIFHAPLERLAIVAGAKRFHRLAHD